MKTKKVLALILAVAVCLSAVPVASFAADDDTLVILDTNDRKTITEAGFEGSAKDTHKTKYAAKWEVDDVADKQIKGFPTDFSKYGVLNFSMKIESDEDAQIMLYIGSENSASSGIDYYRYDIKIAPGEWNDYSVDLSKLSPNREPLGWNRITDLSFRTAGWNNTAAPGTVVYIENVYLSGKSANGAGTTVTESGENAENINKVFYYGNYNDADAGISAGMGVAAKSNSITHEFEGENGFVKIAVTGDVDDCYAEASLKSTQVNKMVVELDLSTTSVAPAGNMQYKDNTADRKTGSLFNISKDGEVLIDGKSAGKLAPGEWLKLGFLFDLSTFKSVAYVNGEKFGEYSLGQTANDLSIMRMYISKNADNVGKDLLVDNFAVYGGDAFRDVSAEYKADATKIVATTAADVEMDHPSASDIGNGVALMVDKSAAYANGQMTKVDENEAVVPVIVDSRTLVPIRFIAESFGAQVGWDEATSTASVSLDGKNISITLGKAEMNVDGNVVALDVVADTMNDRTMLPLRAVVEALGKNVLWDERGLIVITDTDVSLDAQKDVKLSTMLIGMIASGIEAANYAASPSFTQTIIDEAVELKPTPWSPNNGNSNGAEKSACALYYLTLAARFDPDAAASNGTLCKDAAINLVRYLVEGGHEPFACVGCYWGHAVVASSLVLVKNTPVVYDELTADEKERMDWLMRALAIAGNWGYNDKNNYSTGFDLMGNFGKTWNPNYRNTYLSVVLSASMYFGAEELDRIYTEFDYDTYIAKFTELGFTNVLATWTVAGKDLMENGGECKLLGGIGLSYMEAGQPGGTGAGVKLPFLYNGKGPGEIEYLFTDLGQFTYSWKTISEFGTPETEDHTHILSGKKSPMEGQMGMMREFAGSDGGSADGSGSNIRSRCTYGYDSYEILVTVYANMKLFGGWDSSTKEMRELDNRIYVGNEDLIFKMQEGYYGYSSGKGSAEYEYSYNSRGHRFVKDIWRNFHCMLNEEVTTTKDPNAVELEELAAAEPKDGIVDAPEGAFGAVLLANDSTFAPESYYSIGEKLTSATIEFDIVIGDDVVPQTYDSVAMIAKKENSVGWSGANMLFQFTAGTIKIRNGAAYKQTGIQFAPNYRYHVKATFDVGSRKYTAEIGQIYPTAGEVFKAENYDFRQGANAIDFVDSICVVNSTVDSEMWIENVKIVK